VTGVTHILGETVQVVLRVIGVLEDLGVPYHVGGSFASSIHGTPRQTRDLDLVVDLPGSRVPDFAARLESEFYLDADAIRRAVARHGRFNLIHLATGFKVDLFARGPGAFDRSEFARGAPQRLVDDPPREVIVKSAEDTLLRKLQWYREGGESSDQQWADVLGILRTQGERLDLAYLRRWAEVLEVTELLDRSLAS
jgi:hypothetical protein